MSKQISPKYGIAIFTGLVICMIEAIVLAIIALITKLDFFLLFMHLSFWVVLFIPKRYENLHITCLAALNLYAIPIHRFIPSDFEYARVLLGAMLYSVIYLFYWSILYFFSDFKYLNGDHISLVILSCCIAIGGISGFWRKNG